METQIGENTKNCGIKFSIEPIEETPRDKKVREVAEEARMIALEKLSQAKNLTDYFTWHRAASVYFLPSTIDWYWDYGGTTPKELIADQESERLKAGYKKNAIIAEELKIKIDSLEKKEGMIRVALKRVRSKGASTYYYRVLAAFPEGVRVNDPIDSSLPRPISSDQTKEDIIFYEPEAACCINTCDDLYKRSKNGVLYIPMKGLEESAAGLQKVNGKYEYILKKTEHGVVKQDLEDHFRVSILGGFSNEKLLDRISDYW